jgi:hypothetical protein
MEKGISYGPNMVAAKLAARKTQTRRLPDDNLIINVEPDRYKFHCMDSNDQGTVDKPVAVFSDLRPEITPWIEPIPSPYGGVGDWLYTKEAYYTLSEYDNFKPSELPAGAPIHYQADGPKPEGYGRYRHARYMPKTLARFWDEITDLRMERLQDISESDAIAEGIERSGQYDPWMLQNGGVTSSPIQAYKSLWASISGLESLDFNPWVWVVTYKELSRTGRPSDEPVASPAAPVMVAVTGGTPEQSEAAEPTDLVVIPELQELLAQHPGQDAAVLAAYELGMGNLREVLGGLEKPRLPGSLDGRPPYTCINAMPRPVVAVLNTTIVARVLEICLPHSLEGMNRDERRMLGLVVPHLQAFLNRSYAALEERGLLRPKDGLTTLGATKRFIEEMADLHYECLHELNNNADPRQPFAAMHMFNELNMVSAAPAEAEEELACA